MDLFDRINADIKAAMLARDKVRLEALRGIKKEFLEAKTAKGADGTLTEEYLPKQLTDEELTAELRKIIAEVGATSAKEMGRVMGVASKALAGRADGRAISAKVKELLS